MVSERDRIISITKYLESLGITVNIGKNKARGNNGIFLFGRANQYNRIDISNTVEKEKVLPTIIHEFSHYIHKKYNPSMNSLNFVLDDYNDEIEDELINITVNKIPQNAAKALFAEKDKISLEIKKISHLIKSCSGYKSTKEYEYIEKTIKYPFKYLAKYDRVKIFNKIYSIDKINEYTLTDLERQYLTLKSRQRKLRRINSKISRLNKYYNKPSELFARFAEMYFTDTNMTKKIAPATCKQFEEKIKSRAISEFTEFSKLLT